MTYKVDRADINVAPLIDVLLVLLIIFMMITPTDSHGLDARIPSPASADSSQAPPRDVVVRVDENRALTINSQPVSWQDLENRLTQIFSRRAERVLFIQAAPGIEFNDVAQVVDTAKGAGITFVAFMPRESARSK
jgi:biopolymer transport protein TolR